MDFWWWEKCSEVVGVNFKQVAVVTRARLGLLVERIVNRDDARFDERDEVCSHWSTRTLDLDVVELLVYASSSAHSPDPEGLAMLRCQVAFQNRDFPGHIMDHSAI